MKSFCFIVAILSIGGLTGLLHSEPRPFPDRPDHWLAFDTRAFDSESVEQLKLAHGKLKKHPDNPLMQADKPWEHGLNNLYPNVDYDPKAKLFKLWYKCILEDKALIDRMQPPRTTHDVGWYLLYATSRDGLRWKKPLFKHNQFTGAGPTNAVARDTPNAGVFRDTNPDADPKRQYKMIFDTGPGNMWVRFSADGIYWGDPIRIKIPGFRTGDTHNNAFWDERLKKYVLITRYYLGERTIARAESADFVNWERSQMVLRPTIEEGRVHQLYCMPTFRYGNAFVGLIMNYHLGVDRTVDCELAWSPDSVTWHRLLPGKAFIPLGPKGSYDSKCIYAQANPPLIGNDGRLMIFYGGDDAPHRGWVRSCLPCLATVRRDGFAGWRPVENSSGSVTTQPLVVAAEVLSVCADIERGGTINVAVLDADGKPIEGFSAEDSSTITQTVTDGNLRWKSSSIESLQGRLVRLQFTLKGNATLFSVTGLTAAGRPEISPASRSFSDELTVTLKGSAEDAGVVRYTRDGSDPTKNSPVAGDGKIVLSESVTLAARFFPEGHSQGGAIVKKTYVRREPWRGERTLIRHTESFDQGLHSWKAYEEAIHVPKGGVNGSGYVRAERTKNQNPYLSCYPSSSGGVFGGNLQQRYGGTGIDISFSQRAAGAQQPTCIEFFAKELANWSYQKLPPATEEWTRVRVGIRYDWTDEEAKAAGWEPAPDAFSWKETLAHAGRVVFAPIIAQPDEEKWTYDIDEVAFETIFVDPRPSGQVK